LSWIARVGLELGLEKFWIEEVSTEKNDTKTRNDLLFVYIKTFSGLRLKR